VWSTPATLSFTVQPRYWETLWFRTGGVLLLLSLGGGFVWWLLRFRHARMEEKLALQQQRSELAHLGRVASLSELSGSLAHELNQPLAAILSNAQAARRFLDQSPPDLDEVREILTDIAAEDRRAGEVIRRMRRMLKKGETVMEPLPVNTLAEEVLDMIRSDLVARNVSAVTDFAPALPPVQGDRIQLQQVILNLLVNAGEAMTDTPAARRILRVVTAAEAGRVVLTVQDHGHGLAGGVEEKVFEPFYTTKSGGLGMGLALCRSIVTAHGGRLKAMNHPDGGALLRMELPALPETAAPPAA
jgi:two-component system, LuxR family, sensor kinase FixL